MESIRTQISFASVFDVADSIGHSILWVVHDPVLNWRCFVPGPFEISLAHHPLHYLGLRSGFTRVVHDLGKVMPKDGYFDGDLHAASLVQTVQTACCYLSAPALAGLEGAGTFTPVPAGVG
jgi:hypothetical protein